MIINRKQLTEIIEAENGNNWWKPELFEIKIKPFLPSELTVVSNPPVYDKNYNCFVYAFGLQNDPGFLGGKNPVQQEFVKWLILNKVLIAKEIPEKGYIVFYKNEKDEITHSGLMQDKDTVISKWMWGPTIVHKILDVPESFGENVSFFTSPGFDEIKRQYTFYKNTGVKINPIN